MNNTIVISINVFEQDNKRGKHGNDNFNYYYLKEQIKNIKYNTYDFKEVYVILSCNDIIFNRIQNEGLYDEKIKIIINPEIINKRRDHGSLTKGIFSNLMYVIENNINFDYFIVFSSRNVLKRKINLDIVYQNMVNSKNIWDDLSKLNKKFFHNPNYSDFNICDGTVEHGYINYNQRHNGEYNQVLESETSHPQWFFNNGRIKNKLWFKKFQNEFDFIIGGKHESLCFTYDVIKNMYRYIINNIDTMDEIYNTNAFVEEIIPQTLGYHLRSGKDDISFTFLPEATLLQRTVRIITKYNEQFIN